MRILLVALSVFVLSCAAGSAYACSLVKFADDGRYVGGDLVAQIARKADTIQIMRTTARHIIRRHYSEGAWYLSFADTPRPEPDTVPEYIDEFVFDLSVVDTLKGGAQAAADYYENRPRILAYGARELLEFSRQRWPDEEFTPLLNPLPERLLERPGHNGYAFNGGPREGAGLDTGSCTRPYWIDVGQTFIAFRDSMGRLYSSASGLSIDVEFRYQSGRRERFSFNMQSLVPIEGDADPFLVRLRQALEAQTR